MPLERIPEPLIPPAGPTITPGGVTPNGQPADFTISLTVQAYPGGLGPLWGAGQMAGTPVKIPAPATTVVPAVTVVPPLYGTAVTTAVNNPGAMAWLYGR